MVMFGHLQVRVRVLGGVAPVLDRDLPADVLGRARAVDERAHPRGEDAARAHAAGATAGEAPLRVALGLLLVRDRQHAVVAAGLGRGATRRATSTRRRSRRCARAGSACRRRPSASAIDSSGIITPSNGSGALPMTTASMSVKVSSASSSARCAASRTRPGSDTSSRRFLYFVWPMPTTAHGCVAQQSVPFQHADQVLLQHEPDVAWATPRLRPPSAIGGPPRRCG